MSRHLETTRLIIITVHRRDDHMLNTRTCSTCLQLLTPFITVVIKNSECDC